MDKQQPVIVEGINELSTLSTNGWAVLIAAVAVIVLTWFLVEGLFSLLRHSGKSTTFRYGESEHDTIDLLKTEWKKGRLKHAKSGDAVTIKYKGKKEVGKLTWRHQQTVEPDQVLLPQTVIEKLKLDDNTEDSSVELKIFPTSSILDLTWSHPDDGIRIGTRVGLIVSALFFILEIASNYLLSA